MVVRKKVHQAKRDNARITGWGSTRATCEIAVRAILASNAETECELQYAQCSITGGSAMQTTHKTIEVMKVASLEATCVSAASIVTFLKKSRIILTTRKE